MDLAKVMVKLPCAAHGRKCPGQREHPGLNFSLAAGCLPAPCTSLAAEMLGKHSQGALETLRFTNIDRGLDGRAEEPGV